MKKTSYNLLTDRQRLEDIFEVISYFPDKNSKLSDFDRKFMKTCYQQKFLSVKQSAILSKIEMKVFGIDRELEESKDVMR